jgi:malonate-semialdehyde dehydrogenase (acetylating)/methylmalonate-semialdehyde dehydrogenase
VGSIPTGKDVIYKKCEETCKRVIAQCGEKNFMVIMPDCNVKATVPALMTSFFDNTGQRCLAGANLLVVGDDKKFYDSFMEEVVSMSSRIKIGYGLDESIQMGPVPDKEERDEIMGYIEIGIKEKAKLGLDGRKPKVEDGLSDTCFVGSTIFENETADMRIESEEIFGPVMSVFRSKTLEEAVKICNTSPYGNGHAIFTQNGRSAREFQYNVTSVNVGINIGIVAPVAFFPFSGMKDSFFGILHTQGQEAVRFFTESKVIIQRRF